MLSEMFLSSFFHSDIAAGKKAVANSKLWNAFAISGLIIGD